MRFYIVHELRGLATPASGRMRVRASSPLAPASGAALAGALATLPGIEDVRCNPVTGSLLLFYADDKARTDALNLVRTALSAVQYRRCGRFYGNHLHVWILLFQVLGDT